MVIEFLGLPGSGKTYFANKFKYSMRMQGKKYIDISRHSQSPLYIKFIYKVLDNLVYVLPNYRTLISNLRKLSENIIRSPKFLPFSFEYCIRDVVMSVLCQSLLEKNKCIFINDEGVLHKMVFLSVQFDIPINKILSACGYSNRIRTIYIKTTCEKALSNIKKRNRHVCSMDELDDKILFDYLGKYFDSCELVSNLIKMEYINNER